MKAIDTLSIIEPLKEAIIKCQHTVEPAVLTLIQNALGRETSELARFCLQQILDNASIACKTCRPACQDSGQAVFFVSVGQDIRLKGLLLSDALNEAVRLAHTQGYLRLSVADPLTRINTGTNTPAVIHTELVAGDKMTVSYLAKGAGSENMGGIYLLPPSKGRQGIIDSARDCVIKAGSNSCPPVILGIGIGGTMEKAAILSKKALLRTSGKPSEDKDIASLEQKILDAVNKSGAGVQGMGGNNTALAVHIEACPTHIGMLPVAITIQCHSVRHFTMEF